MIVFYCFLAFLTAFAAGACMASQHATERWSVTGVGLVTLNVVMSVFWLFKIATM